MNPTNAFIVGESKAGTSSMYRYLGDHPEIQTSLVKQTNYFLASNYPWTDTSQVRLYEADRGETYNTLFGKIPSATKCLLDVSPDYMYCEKTPEFLEKYLSDKDYVFIFILRDPIQRLLSWYRFGKQIQIVPNDMDFSMFLEKQGAEGNRSMAFNALETGRFLKYVNEFESKFSKKSVVKLAYAQLKSDPCSLLKNLSNRLGVSAQFYDSYQFTVHNRSEKVRNNGVQKIYIGSQRFYHRLMSTRGYLQPLFQFPIRLMASAYRKLNLTEPNSIEIDDATLSWLKDYYSEEYLFLQKLDWESDQAQQQ